MNTERFAKFVAKLADDVYSEPITQTHSIVTKGGVETVLGIIGRQPENVLDVGCGQGPALEIFRDLGIVATGISLNDNDITICRKAGHDVRKMDQNDLEFDDGIFDFIWARHVLEHSIAPFWTLHEFYRVLKPGGWLYAEMPAPDTVCTHEANGNHYCVLGERAWEFLIGRAGFRPDNVLKWEVPTPIGTDVYFGFVARKPVLRVGTCLPVEARKVLAEQVRLTADIPGELAEVGVYKGGSAAIIAENKMVDKPLHLFDTFRGLPEPTEADTLKRGEFGDVDLKKVREDLAIFPNVIFQVGLFEWTSGLLYQKEWSFVHLDGDLYETTLQGLKFFYPKMSSGGIILLDDFGHKDCPGVEKAAREFMDGKPEQIEMVGNRQARIVKK